MSEPYLPYSDYSKVCAAFAVPLSIAGLLTGGLARGMLWVAASFAWLGVVVFAFLAWRSGSLLRRLRDRHFAHWTYSEAEWHAFLDRTRSFGGTRKAIWGWSLGMGAAMAAGFFFGKKEDPEVAPAIAAAGVMIFAVIVASACEAVARRHAARTRSSTPECWIGEVGYYLTGEAGRWEGGWKNPGIDEETGDLCIGFSTGPDSHVGARIPVPPGEEKMASKLVKHFKPD